MPMDKLRVGLARSDPVWRDHEAILEKVTAWIAELDHRIVLEERQSLDVAGHYSRPDVTRPVVDRRRQSTAEFSD